MGIPLLEGRLFESRDTADAPKAIVINRTMARQYWPDESPIGKVVRMSWGDIVEGQVAGVGGDVLHRSLAAAPDPTLYWVNDQLTYGGLYLVVRSAGDPTTLTSAIRGQLGALDPALPVFGVQTMEHALADSVSSERMMAQLLGTFAFVAVLLAAVGIYGVVSYSVSQRTREIGIRMALGAPRRGILQMVMRQMLFLTTIGVVIGLAGAAALTRFIESFLFGTSPTDTATFIAIPVVLLVIVLLACYLPARRATHVHPNVALRYE